MKIDFNISTPDSLVLRNTVDSRTSTKENGKNTIKIFFIVLHTFNLKTKIAKPFSLIKHF
jgi:hypothetical protein